MRGIDIETKRKLCEMGAGTLLNPGGSAVDLSDSLAKLAAGPTAADVVPADALRVVSARSPTTSLQQPVVSGQSSAV